MNSSRTDLLDSLRKLQSRRRGLIRRLSREKKLAIGTVSTVYRKCGNPQCHCADGPRHPQTLFLFKDRNQKRRRCKLVRRADEAWMLQAGENYRQFRQDIRQLRAIDSEEKQILMALAELRAVRYV